jgi:hypothetical protein
MAVGIREGTTDGIKEGSRLGKDVGYLVGKVDGWKDGSVDNDGFDEIDDDGFGEILGRDDIVGLSEGNSDGATEGSGGQYPHACGQALPTSPQ